MSVVHIALVGGQTMPVYVAIKESVADKFVLVHSSSTKAQADCLLRDIESKCGKPVVLIELEPNDYLSAKAQFELIIPEYEESTIEVNISSGTKPWTVAVAKLSEKYDNVELIYVDQNSRIYNYKTGITKDIIDLSTEDIFRFNQTAVQSFVSLDDYTEQDLEVLSKIKLVRNRYINQFNALTIPTKKNLHNALTYNKEGRFVDDTSSSEIVWNKNVDGEQYVRLYFAGRHEEFEFQSPHAFDMTVTSGWFEYEVADILAKWKKHSLEIWMNVVFPYNNKNPKNEIDVIVNVGNKLLFVECKIQVKDKTDIDKFASAVKNYGGMGAKALFLTQQNMPEQAIEKCETNKIAQFSLVDENNHQRKRKELFDLLDKIMFENNAR